MKSRIDFTPIIMKKLLNQLCYFNICLCCILFSCSSDSNSVKEENEKVEINNESPIIEEEANSKNGCKYENGTYPAVVNYNNSKTGFSKTYTLNVEVEDCQVIQINFPNGGHLDEDHISPGDIDENGNAYLSEENKNYEIQIQD